MQKSNLQSQNQSQNDQHSSVNQAKLNDVLEEKQSFEIQLNRPSQSKLNTIIFRIIRYIRSIPKFWLGFICVCLLLSFYLIIQWFSSQKSIDSLKNDKEKINRPDEQKLVIFDLVTLNTTSALCLDGSPAAYYVSRDGDPSKIYLHFQGGGWVGGQLDNIYFRSKDTLFGSSKGHSSEKTFTFGTFMPNHNNNFRDWKKILMLYCDGTGHQGFRKQPIQYQDSLLYFRGHNITTQKLQNLQEKLGLFTRASQVVVGGDSAGALAAMMWTNYIVQRVKNGKVWTFVDSPIFMDVYSFKENKVLFKQNYRKILTFSNEEIDLPVPQCIERFPDQKQNCFFAQNIHQYLKAPLFVAQPLYDMFSIACILEVPCLNNTFSLQKCNHDQLSIIQQHRKNVTNVLNEMGRNKQNGYWAPACAYHFFSQTYQGYYSQRFRIPQKSQNSLKKSVSQWLDKSSKNNHHIDTVEWPYNKPCSGLSK